MYKKKKVSIVVPAYNEGKRIIPFLKDLIAFCKNANHELIVVDDGSTDDTFDVAKKLTKNFKEARVISYKPNMGKGYAVRTGVLAAKGGYVIFIDADGSTPPTEIPKMVEKLNKYDVVVGDRTSVFSKTKQPKFRRFLEICFYLYMNTLFRVNSQDLLCGFKGFRREAGRILFKDLISYRWIFDVEIFYRAKKKNYSLYKLPIQWTHKPYSKLKTTDPFKMMLQALSLRMRL